MDDPFRPNTSRSAFVRTLGGIAIGGSLFSALRVPGLAAPQSLKGTGQVTVSDPGGPFTKAWGEAYFAPFQQASGIKAIQVAREHEPVGLIKSQVESKAYQWDACGGLTLQAYKQLSEAGLLEKIRYNDFPFAPHSQMIADSVHDTWMGTDVFAVTLAYRTDKFPKSAPRTWADLWDIKKFPGRRALQKSAINTLEVALLADGVDPKRLYPLDVDRAFRKLDQIKKDVTLWWTAGAQTTQGLQSGEIDIAATYNARAQLAADSGAPVAISWERGIYTIEGLAILKGAPNTENAMRFIAFASQAKAMAAWAKDLAYGPTNHEAYKFIDKAHAKLLPTYEGNIKHMSPTDYVYWSKNFESLTDKFNTWLAS